MASDQQAVSTSQTNATSTANAVPATQKQVSVTSAQVTLAQQVQASAQAKVDTAQQLVNSASATVKQDQAKVDSASASVKTAQDAVNGVGLGSAQAALTSAQAAQTSAQKTADSASAALATVRDVAAQADNDVAKAQTANDQAQSALTSAQSAQASAQSTADSASNVVASDQVAVNSAQDAVNSAQAALDSVNTITLPSGYVSAFKGNVAGTVSSSELEAVAKPGVAMNTYKDNVVAEKEVVSTNGADVSLTSEQEKQLTLFIAELVNSVRNQVGSSAVKVTEESLAYSKTIIKGYNATGTQPVTHNSKVIVNAEKLYNVNSGEDLSLFFGDDSTPLTMNDIFGRAYNGLVGMLFNDADSNWGHTYSILGQNPRGISFGQEYLGVDSDQWGDTQYEFIGLNSTTTNGTVPCQGNT